MAMPAGPLVRHYRVHTDTGPMTEYGWPGMNVYLEVNWDEEAAKVEASRQFLFKDRQKEIDLYHSQAAISGTWLLLNELKRKIIKTQDYYDVLTDKLVQSDPAWDELNQGIYDSIYHSLRFDPIYAVKYAQDHESSTIIPSSAGGRGRKWSELDPSELKYIFELSQYFLEDLTTNFDKLRYRTHFSDVPGRGIRARSEQIDGMQSRYKLSYTRSRQVVFCPYLSTWYAFMSTERKLEHWEMLKKGAEAILGVDVILPPIEKGHFWYRLAEYIKDGKVILNGDGSNWETWSATILDLFIESVDDGIFQYMSGTSSTSRNGSFASLKRLEWSFKNMRSRIDAVAVLGDDVILIGDYIDPRDFQEEGIFEIDDIATRNHIYLGCKIWIGEDGGYHGTFPGMYRVTVDRGDKRVPISIGQMSDPIKSGIDTASKSVYLEIMSEGTLHGEPFIDAIQKIEVEDFWDEWARDRYSFLGSVEKSEEEENGRGTE